MIRTGSSTLLFVLLLSACVLDRGTGSSTHASCSLTASAVSGGSLGVTGCGLIDSRFTAELAVRDSIAYTTTWGFRAAQGNMVAVWRVSGAQPVLVDSAIVSGASTLGDVAITDDGKWLVVATERTNGSLVIFDLADPRHPRQVARLATPETFNGVHTAEVGRVAGHLYAFLAIDALSGAPTPESKIVIVDLGDPTNPQQIFVKSVPTTAPFAHDTFLRDGLLFVALWNAGIEIWDLGGGGHGGTPSAPVVIGSVATLGGDAHNIWWLRDVMSGSRYAFVGEESAPAQLGVSSAGDIHVLDVSDLTHPREVAFYHVPGAGTHNFSVDETNGILYAAYYNAGVRALDVRGDLETCAPAQQVVTGALVRCDLAAMGREVGKGLSGGAPPVYVWGVQYVQGQLYASDMLNGLWKLQAVR
ncbi:MAG: LVIVD repeat-containing protein [Gemmatimonadaceae bacterium]